MTWPAFAYLYGTWGYALNQALEHSRERNQKVYVYQARFGSRNYWVASWDPKEKA